jgi:hypothetical protein
MQIVLTNPATKRRWLIRPVSNGLCFEILKSPTKKIGKNKKEIKSEWLHTGKYPWSLDHAIKLTISLMMLDTDDETAMKFCTTETEKLFHAIETWCRSITWKILEEADGTEAITAEEEPVEERKPCKKQGEKVYVTKTCSRCGKDFNPTSGRQKYCSKSCRLEQIADGIRDSKQEKRRTTYDKISAMDRNRSSR